MPVDVTEDNIRLRQVEPSRFDAKSFRTITISEGKGIKAIVACPKGSYVSGRCKVGMRTQSYLFSKAKGWTTAKAKAWIKSHRSGTTKKESETEKSLRTKLKNVIEKKRAIDSQISEIYEKQGKEREKFEKEQTERRNAFDRALTEKNKEKLDTLNQESSILSNEMQILYNAIGEEMAED